jgi:hypothetical protein
MLLDNVGNVVSFLCAFGLAMSSSTFVLAAEN